MLPLLAKYPGRLRKKACTLSNFQIAAAFVASRAFGIDEWHGALVAQAGGLLAGRRAVGKLLPLPAGVELHLLLGRLGWDTNRKPRLEACTPLQCSKLLRLFC